MHRFKKEFGQNFLRGERFARELIAPLDLNPGDTVIEIGPGEGAVTKLLLGSGCRVISVEVDYSLMAPLLSRFRDNENFELVNADVMSLDLAATAGDESGRYKVTGSLPYNISKPIIAKLLTAEHPPTVMSFIVQQEVAEDYASQPPKSSFLSNWASLYARVRKGRNIPAANFFPKPKVNGAVITFELSPRDENARAYTEQAAGLLRTGFASPRKTLWNNLRNSGKYTSEQLAAAWQQVGISEKIRPAELAPDQWRSLTYLLANA